jgi:type IV secretion system protein VirB8
MTQAEEKAYLDRAKEYDRDRWADKCKSDRRGWATARAQWGVIALLVLGYVFLLAKWEPVPFLVTVDKSTGRIETVSRLTPAKTQADVVNESYIAQYIECREGYSVYLLQDHWKQCALMTPPDEPLHRLYTELFDWKQPTSLYARYNEHGRAVISNITVIPFPNNVAQVRYLKTELRPGDQQPKASYWAGRIAYEYAGWPEERLCDPACKDAKQHNPYRFRVLEFRAKEENEGSK